VPQDAIWSNDEGRAETSSSEVTIIDQTTVGFCHLLVSITKESEVRVAPLFSCFPLEVELRIGGETNNRGIELNHLFFNLLDRHNFLVHCL
jgi:hypothetical protein